MKKDQVAKMVGRHVRLRPMATTASGDRLDDDWVIVNVSDTRLDLQRVPDDAPLRLGLDHVHRYSSDPDRDEEPHAPYGILVLTERVVRRDTGRFGVEVILPGDLERQMAGTAPYSPEVLAEAKAQYELLDPVSRAALARLLLVGEMTDRQMEKYLSQKGLAHGAQSVLQHLSNGTPLVAPAIRDAHRERVLGYEGPYLINSLFRDALKDVIAGS
jgi:hypothetical protein